MTNDEIRNLAVAYLIKNRIPYVEPCEFGVKDGIKQEIIFISPLALGPGVVDPPDVRLWVNTKTREVTLIIQM